MEHTPRLNRIFFFSYVVYQHHDVTPAEIITTLLLKKSYPYINHIINQAARPDCFYCTSSLSVKHLYALDNQEPILMKSCLLPSLPKSCWVWGFFRSEDPWSRHRFLVWRHEEKHCQFCLILNAVVFSMKSIGFVYSDQNAKLIDIIIYRGFISCDRPTLSDGSK